MTMPSPTVRPVTDNDYAAWRPLWDGYNAFYGRHAETALPEHITHATWQRFRAVPVFSDKVPFTVSAANAGGELQLGVGELIDGKQVARHTIRRADGTWQPVRSIPTTGLPGTDNDIATFALAVTPR